MTWHAGAHVIVRRADWRVVRSTTFSDCEALDLAARRAHSDNMRRTLLVPFDRPRAAAARRLRVVSRRQWGQAAASLLATSFPYGGLQFCAPAIQLLPYQLEPALAMLRHGVIRLLVADDVGLGKTVEAGLIIREIAKADRLSRILIVVPSSLREQWGQELHSLFELQTVIADAAWLRKATRELPRDVNPWSLPGIHLTSMDFVKRPEALRPLEDLRWDLIVIDEAHGATPRSDRHAALHALACRARRVVLLTATPHSGDERQFEALSSIGAIADGPPLAVFSRTHGETGLANPPIRRTVLTVRLSDAERRMHRLLEEYTARIWSESRRRNDAGGELLATVLRKRALSSARSLALSLTRRMQLLAGIAAPPSQLRLPLADEDAREDDAEGVLGAKGLANDEDEQLLLAALAEAAATAARYESKLHVLLRFARRIREPVIVFSEYRDTAERLRDELCAHGHRVYLLHGGLTPDERRRALSSFGAGGALLVATDAASEGLNLHAICRAVIHFELPWTPSRLNQRCGRVNRLGQTRRVHEIALVADDTAEQLVLEPLLRRAARSGTLSPASIVGQLPEARVAAHVMEGAPLSSADRQTPTFVAMRLQDEAQEEAARLHLIRRLRCTRLSRRPNPRRVRDEIPVSSRKSITSQVICLVELTLNDAAAGVVARDVIGLRFHLDPVRSRRSAAMFRAGAEQLLACQRPQLSAVVERMLAARLLAARRMHDPMAAARRERERDMQRRLRSTARELVQAGLFDRRALRAARARTRTDEMLEDEARTHWPVPILEGRFDVRAVLYGAAPA